MPKRSRMELKNIFSKGKIPEEKDFHDLIDSMLNWSDERLGIKAGGGLVLYNGPDNGLLEFYESPEAGGPDWYIRRENTAGQNGFDIGESVLEESERNLKPKSRLFIQEDWGVGINNDQPNHILDVAGDVAMENRVGTYAQGSLPADGQWRNIIPTDRRSGPVGYYGMEVFAHTISREDRNWHSITHAICVACFPRGTRGLKRLFGISNRKGIQPTTYFYSRRRQRIQLRWAGSYAQPRLEIRSRRRMKGVAISYRITSLFPA